MTVTSENDPDRPDFGITDDEGNAELSRLLAEVVVLTTRGEAERREAVVVLGDGVRELADRYPEANDVTVRTAVVRELDPVFVDAGWDHLEPFEF